MIKPTLRLIALLTMFTLFFILFVIDISPNRFDRLGTISALTSSSQSVDALYLDLDTGITLRQRSDLNLSDTGIPFERTISVIYNASTATQTLYFVRENGTTALERIEDGEISVLGIYEEFYPVEAYWNLSETVLYVIDTGNRQDTTIHAISPLGGQLTPLTTIENFVAGFAQPSPNMRYLLVRALDNIRSDSDSVAGRFLYLVDLETLEVRNMGQPNGAYWSPDSSKIAIGTVSERRFMMDISVYDVASGETTPLDLQASHTDLDVFESVRRSGLIWTPDSSGMAILNRYDNILHYITLEGDYTSVEGKYLRPMAWSSDNRHVLAIGDDVNNTRGVFIVDFETQRTTLIERQSPNFISVQGGVVWSPDGNYVMLSDWTNTIIYDVHGQAVLRDVFRNAYPGLQIIPQSVAWYLGE